MRGAARDEQLRIRDLPLGGPEAPLGDGLRLVLEERLEEVHRGENGPALGGGDVEDRAEDALVQAAAEEAHRGVVLHPEHLLAALLEVDGGVGGDVLEDHRLQAAALVVGGDVVVDVELGGRVAAEVVDMRFLEGPQVRVPRVERVEQAQAIGEILRAEQEAPAVGSEAVGLGAGGRDLPHRLGLGDVLRHDVAPHRAGDQRQLLLRVALGGERGLGFRL